MFISPAYAQAAGGGGGEQFLTGILPLVLIFAVFYFLLIRPQQRRMKEHKQKISSVRRGDRIITGGGIIGTVSKVVSDEELQVEIAEGVKVRVARQTVQEVLSKTEPASAGGKETEKPAGKSETGSSQGSQKKSVFRRGSGSKGSSKGS